MTSLIFVTWLICVTWLIHVTHMNDSRHIDILSKWHDSFICVTCLICICWVNTHIHILSKWHDSFTCVTCLIYICWVNTHIHVLSKWHDSFTWHIWMIHVIYIYWANDTTQSYVWHVSYTYVECIQHDSFTWHTCTIHVTHTSSTEPYSGPSLLQPDVMHHVTHVHESCRTHLRQSGLTLLQPDMNESCHTNEWVVSHVSVADPYSGLTLLQPDVALQRQVCHRVMSHVYVSPYFTTCAWHVSQSHVTHGLTLLQSLVTQINESCDTQLGCVTESHNVCGMAQLCVCHYLCDNLWHIQIYMWLVFDSVTHHHLCMTHLCMTHLYMTHLYMTHWYMTHWYMTHLYMTHWYVWHDSVTHLGCVTESCHTYQWVMSRTFSKIRPLQGSAIDMCDMTHSYVWHDSFTCVTWLIHMRMNESCHTYEWVMSHIWLRDIMHMN